MSIVSFYRRMPAYVATTVALIGSAMAALILAAFIAAALDGILDKLQGGGANLGNGILAWFYVAPSIALVAFVSCFSLLVSWHRATSWRIPTFAFAVGAFSVWLWGRDWLGATAFLPGVFCCIVSSWMLQRRSSQLHHVLQA